MRWSPGRWGPHPGDCSACAQHPSWQTVLRRPGPVCGARMVCAATAAQTARPPARAAVWSGTGHPRRPHHRARPLACRPPPTCLDEDGAGGGLGHILHKGVLLLPQDVFVDTAGLAQALRLELLHGVHHEAPARQLQALRVPSLGSPARVEGRGRGGWGVGEEDQTESTGPNQQTQGVDARTACLRCSPQEDLPAHPRGGPPPGTTTPLPT